MKPFTLKKVYTCREKTGVNASPGHDCELRIVLILVHLISPISSIYTYYVYDENTKFVCK